MKVKKLGQKRISLLLVVLLVLSSLPMGVVASAAERTDTVLCEPDVQWAGVDSAYGDVAVVAVSGFVYQLVEYADGEVRTLGDQYSRITEFSNSGYAVMYSEDGMPSVINYKGEIVTNSQYQYLEGISDDGYVIAASDYESEKVLLNLNDGTTTALPSSGADGYTYSYGTYNNGCMPVQVYDENWETVDVYYADTAGNVVIPGPFQSISSFSNHYAIVQKDEEGTPQIIDTSGTVVLEDASLGGTVDVYGRISEEGLVMANDAQNYKTGYMDVTGKLVIPCQYEFSSDFHNGYAVVRNDDWELGLIDAKGNIVIPFGTYRTLSRVSNTGIVWATKHDSGKPAVLRVGDSSSKPTVGNFNDVYEDDYFADAVLWAVENGITTGTGKNQFSPSSPCTRGQIVTFLWRNAGEPEPKTTSQPFTDVKPTDYYYKAVLWAVENSITSGMGKDKFGPASPCTRGQAVTFLWRAAGSPSAPGMESSFTDIQSGSYYEKAVNWAVANDITAGTSTTTFSPDKSCTRGQIVTFLYRADG